MSTAITCLACGSGNHAPWAQARDLEYFTSDEVFTYHRCTDCDAIFIDPVPVDRLSEIYPANYYSFGDHKAGLAQRVKEAMDRRMFKKLLRQIKEDQLHVLDVGGGTGWLLQQVKACDERVKFLHVVDIDAGAEKRALANGCDFFCGRIEDFETPLRFDLILMLNLVEHVADPRAVMAKAALLLKPGGRLLIKTPNTDSWDARKFRHKNWGGYHCPRHWVLFTKESFLKMTEPLPLELMQFSYTQGAPFWTWSFLFTLYRKGWIRISKERPVMFHPLVPVVGAFFAALDMLRKPFAKTSQMFFTFAGVPETSDTSRGKEKT